MFSLEEMEASEKDLNSLLFYPLWKASKRRGCFEEVLSSHHISGQKGRAESVSQFWQSRTLKPREET